MKHGGKRAGAGRKPLLGTLRGQAVTIVLPIDLLHRIDKKGPRSRVIRELLLVMSPPVEYFQNDAPEGAIELGEDVET